MPEKNMNPLFLKLIQPGAFSAPFDIGEDELSEVIAEAKRHNLLSLIYSRVNRMKPVIPPGSALMKFLQNSRSLYMRGAACSMRQESVEQEIIRLLASRGIPALVIKGSSLARMIYEDENCRASVDIDILVKKKDIVAADAILGEMGYSAESEIPVQYCIHRLHHALYYHRNTDCHIEIHWNFAMPFLFNISSEEIWDETASTPDGLTALSPEMTLIMLLTHHHSHSFRELRILVDILWAFYKYDRVIDRGHLLRKLKEGGLVTTTFITLSQMKGLWNDLVSKIESIQFIVGKLDELDIRRSGFLFSYFTLKGDEDIPSSIYKDRFIARFALDRWSNIFLSISNTLFPVPDAIKGLYHDQRSRTLPLNYVKYLCWKIKDWTGTARAHKRQ